MRLYVTSSVLVAPMVRLGCVTDPNVPEPIHSSAFTGIGFVFVAVAKDITRE